MITKDYRIQLREESAADCDTPDDALIFQLLDTIDEMERERDAYRKAKSENDDRFQGEAADNLARAERAEADAAAMRGTLTQCVFEGLTNHGRLIPSERLTMALERGRHVLDTDAGKNLLTRHAEEVAELKADAEAARVMFRGGEEVCAAMHAQRDAATAEVARLRVRAARTVEAIDVVRRFAEAWQMGNGGPTETRLAIDAALAAALANTKEGT